MKTIGNIYKKQLHHEFDLTHVDSGRQTNMYIHTYIVVTIVRSVFYGEGEIYRNYIYYNSDMMV